VDESVTHPNDQVEHWLPVVGWETLYEVSDLGRVRSLPRRGLRRDRVYGGKILRPSLDTRGYFTVGLCEGGRGRTRCIHLLVTEAFIGPRPDGQEVRHGPNGKLDNRVSQLCYGTHKENLADRLRDGTPNRGERHGEAKLTWDAVAEIRRQWAAGPTSGSRRTLRIQLGEEFGVSAGNIWLVVTGKAWIDYPTRTA
jgi:hypothetical protein